jgi:hypothetical protein
MLRIVNVPPAIRDAMIESASPPTATELAERGKRKIVKPAPYRNEWADWVFGVRRLVKIPACGLQDGELARQIVPLSGSIFSGSPSRLLFQRLAVQADLIIGAQPDRRARGFHLLVAPLRPIAPQRFGLAHENFALCMISRTGRGVPSWGCPSWEVRHEQHAANSAQARSRRAARKRPHVAGARRYRRGPPGA